MEKAIQMALKELEHKGDKSRIASMTSKPASVTEQLAGGGRKRLIIIREGG